MCTYVLRRKCNTSVSDAYKHGWVTTRGLATSNNEYQRVLFHCNVLDIFNQITPIPTCETNK